MPAEYIFLITRPNTRVCTITTEQAAPIVQLEALLDDVLVEVEQGLWATADRQTTVERLAWLPVGSLPEDHLGSGVPVAVAR